MKKLTFTLLFVMNAVLTFSQIESPVKWSYIAIKKAESIYEVVLTAVISKPWHIYSQNMQEGGPVPTKITFAKNPLIVLQGKIIEKGNMKTVHDKIFDNMEVKFYSDKVQFVQVMKAKAKTNIIGKVHFMVCNDKECKPPVDENFSIKLN